MKPNTLYTALVTAAMLTACGGKKNDPVPPKEESSWTLGNYKYDRVISLQTTAGEGQGAYASILASTSSETSTDYGPYSGSSLELVFYTASGPGQYTLTTRSEVQANPTKKLIYVSCKIGIQPPVGEAVYEPAANTGAVVEVTKDDKGDYHISLPGKATLTKVKDIGGSIPPAPQTYDLIIKNAR